MFLPFLAAASVAAALTRRIVANCCARKPLQGMVWRRVRRLRRVIWKSSLVWGQAETSAIRYSSQNHDSMKNL